MQKISLFIVLLVLISPLLGQSLEIMPGTERMFIDAQWLRQFEDRQWSLFSRSRATDDYDGNTNLFTGAYLNYTTSKGFGATLVGRTSSRGSGFDTGLHLFKAESKFMIYALASIGLSDELSYSWFSMARFYPPLTEKWKLYTSLELFSNFAQHRHAASVQRIRAGLDWQGLQFGLAVNLSGLGKQYEITDTNPGLFVRKQF